MAGGGHGRPRSRAQAPARGLGLRAVLLVLLLAAPSWSAAAAAPAPLPAAPAAPLPRAPSAAAPLDLLLEGLARGADEALAPAKPLAPDPPEPADAAARAQALAADAAARAPPAATAAAEGALEGPIAPLLEEDFEDVAALLARGWRQEVVRGRGAWGVADAVNRSVARLDGGAFEPERDDGRNVIVTASGRRAATMLNPVGRYDAFIDNRLVSPVIDLGHVRGASARTDAPHDAATQDEAGEPYRVLLQAWRTTLGPYRLGTAHGQAFDHAYGWALTTPPSQLQRLYLGPNHRPLVGCAAEGGPPAVAVPLVGGALPPGAPRANGIPCPPGDEVYANPLAERYGAAMVNLTFASGWSLDPGRSPEVPGTNLDGAFLEVRVVRPDGTRGPWEHLVGDAVFEPGWHHNGTLGGLAAVGANAPSELSYRPGAVVGGGVRPPVRTGGNLSETRVDGPGLEKAFTPTVVGYNGRVQLRPLAECWGTAARRVDCEPDAPAFVRWSAPPGTAPGDRGAIVRHHFTLNRYAGERIELAWRLHSGVGSVAENATGWFVDDVRVEALLPARDLGLEPADRPRAGDLVGTHVAVRPAVVVRNHGHRPMEGALVRLAIEEAPAALPEPRAAEAPAPGELARSAGDLARPRAVRYAATVEVPRLPPLGRALVEAPDACAACPPGRYVLRADVAPSPAGGAEGALDRPEDGNPLDDRLEVPFEVRDAARAELRVEVPPGAVLTDVDEPKAVEVLLRNTGNVPLTGRVALAAVPLDAATLEPVPGAARARVGVVPVLPGALDPGDLLTSYAGPRPTLRANATWDPRGLAPGVYRVEAVFEADRPLEAPAEAAAAAFIRATPTPYFPSDGRRAEDFEGPPADPDGFGADEPRSRGFEHDGFRCPATCTWEATPLPIGPVTGPRTWNATGADGPFLELSALALLAGHSPGVGLSPTNLAVYAQFHDTGYRVCAGSRPGVQPPATCVEGAALTRYDSPEGLASSLPSQKYDQHSLLNDLYLTREVDLTACDARCRPRLTFWHTGDLEWQGTPRPSGAPWAGAWESASPDHLAENRSRAAVELVPLDGRSAALAAEVVPPAAPGCGPSCPAPVPTPVPVACAPLPGAPAGVPAAARAGPVRAGAPAQACPGAVPLGQGVVLAEWRAPVEGWQPVTLDLAPWAGRRVALAFHFQTTVGRLQVNQSQLACFPSPPGAPPDPETAAFCLGRALPHWTLDNIVLDAGPASFADRAGDHGNDTAHEGWERFRLLRDAIDANAPLDPSCFAPLKGIRNATDPPPALGAACLARSGLRGLAVGVEGRGWERFTHLAARQRNGVPNPYYDGWFLDEASGRPAAGGPRSQAANALRWGGPGTGGGYPTLTTYNRVATPLLDLSRAARPVAQFELNHSFSLEDEVPLVAGAVRDGAALVLARHAPDPACVLPPCRLVLDRRALVAPEGGYPGRVEGILDEAVAPGLWDLPRGAATNAFTGKSGPLAPAWVPMRVDLAAGLAAMCVKRVEAPDGASHVASFGAAGCAALGRRAAWEDDGAGVVAETGLRYVNVTSFADDPDARYALEVHTQSYEAVQGDALPGSQPTNGFGLAIDDLRVAEPHLANDVGVTAVLVPAPGRWVGPGEEVAVRVQVTNHGVFTQQGLRVHYNVTQQGVQVFPDPGPDRERPVASVAQVTPRSLPFPGRRDAVGSRNVTVAFEVPWVPARAGVYTLNAWTEVVGLEAAGRTVPLADEDPRNDLLSVDVDVLEAHRVRLAPSSAFPDARAVAPLVGVAGEPRRLQAVVENLGTVAEGLAHGPSRALRAEVEVRDEAGRRVERREADVDHLAPGRSLLLDFGEAWTPAASGLHRVTFRLRTPYGGAEADLERVVPVLVLTQVFPTPGAPWTAQASADGGAWSQEGRLGFATGEGWTFGRGEAYDPGLDGALRLAGPIDLASYRNAFLAVRHAYDFEEGYDGGVVEVSRDGVAWEALQPGPTYGEDGEVLHEGYPEPLTTASPEAARPGGARRAFTGASAGVVTTIVPLASAAASRTDEALLLRDPFDPPPAGEPPGVRGAWREALEQADVPGGKAWWVDKRIVWRHGPFGLAAKENATTLDGSKELRAGADGRIVVPAVAAPLRVEFLEWRALGLPRRDPATLAQPNAVEVVLQRLDPLDRGKVTLEVPVLPPTASWAEPYGDNYAGWTRRSYVVPSRQAEELAGHAVRLAFRLHLAGSHDAGLGPGSPVNLAMGTGRPEDTDAVSPHLGWAIAAPRLMTAVPKSACDAAGGRAGAEGCVLFDDPLAYEDGDAAEARAVWSAGWRTLNHTRASGDPEVLTSEAAGGDALVEGGWRLVEATGALGPKPVWDRLAPSPPRAGKGLVAEATGWGASARLVAPLDLRSAAGTATLSLEHSFKFADLAMRQLSPPMTVRGAHSGGRVEVSRDDGRTWIPLAPVVEPSYLSDGTQDRLAYTKGLAAQGFQRVFLRGDPADALLCQRPLHRGCVDLEDPFGLPIDPLVPGRAPFQPYPSVSTHTAFGGDAGDPEGDSPFGTGSMAFAGTTCVEDAAAETWRDWCTGAEDWRRVRFDLTPFAGQEVLLAFHAAFASHRFVREPHVACADGAAAVCTLEHGDDEVLVPRDFWRIDNVTVEAQLLAPAPLHVRLRGFTDQDGPGYGWDVLNVSLLGDRHLRNLGVRLAAPAEGEPPRGGQLKVDARVVNQGQEPLVARGHAVVEQAGSPALANGGFEARAQRTLDLPGRAWTWAPDGWTVVPAAAGNVSAYPVEGAHAAVLTADGASGDPFRLRQDVRVPPGRWLLTGYADVEDRRPGGGGRVGLTVQGAAADDGTADPTLALPTRPPGQPEPTGLRWRRFALPFTVAGEEAVVRVEAHARRDALLAEAPFLGTARLDRLAIEPAPSAAAAAPLRNAGFEEGLDGWEVAGQARAAGVVDRWLVRYPTSATVLAPQERTLEGDGEVLLPVAVPATNLTRVDVSVLVEAPGALGSGLSARAADDAVRVEVVAPDGRTGSATATLKAGARAVVAPVLLPTPVLGRREVAGTVEAPPGTQVVRSAVPTTFAAPPTDVAVRASSAEEALAAVGDRTRDDGRGTWLVRVSVRSAAPAELHAEAHRVVVNMSYARYAARAEPAAAGVAVVPEGAASGVLAGTGHGTAALSQRVAVEAGRWRLSGVLGTLPATWSLAGDDDGAYLDVPNGATLTQGLRGDDLPRHVTAVRLWPTNLDAARPFDLLLLDGRGTVLAANRNVAVGGQPLDVPLDVHPPLGGQLRLQLVAREAFRLQLRPGHEYAGGALAGHGGADADLRAAFLGPVEPGTGLAMLHVAGGAGTADASATEVPLEPGTEPTLRQVVDLGDAPARRLTGVRVRLVLPEAPAQRYNATHHYAVRQGEVRAQLLDAGGRPLSDEATFAVDDHAGPATDPAAVRLPAKALLADFAFTNAFLPPGTREVQVALRAVNFSDDRARGGLDRRVRATALPDLAEAAEGPPSPERLLVGRAPLLAAAGCVALPAGDAGDGAHGCDLALNLTYAREGEVVLEVAGAVGEPLRVVQPTSTAAIVQPGVRLGGLAFDLDVDVPPGVAEATVRLRADRWQGDVLLDALTLRPLTPPAVAFRASVGPGQEGRLAGDRGAAASFPTVEGASYRVRAEARAFDAHGRAVAERVAGDNVAERVTAPALGPGRVAIAGLRAAPNGINLTTGDRVHLELALRNEGETEATVRDLEVTLAPRGAPQPLLRLAAADLDPPAERIALGPLEERLLAWTVPADPSWPHGMYLLRARVGTAPAGDAVGLPDEAEALVYVGTDFHRQFGFQWGFPPWATDDAPVPDRLGRGGDAPALADMWTTQSLRNPKWPPENICNDPGRIGANGPNDPCVSDAIQRNPGSWAWQKTDEPNMTFPMGITLGGDPDDPLTFPLCCMNEGIAEGTVFAVLRSKAIPIADQQAPQLLFGTKHQFSGPDAEGSVYARLLRRHPVLGWEAFPDDNCITETDARGWVAIDPHVQGASPGYAAAKWAVRNHDLAPLLARARAELSDPGTWDHVQLCWLIEQPTPRHGAALMREWSLDEVAVTPYGVDVGPSQAAPIRDNVTKDFRLTLRNRGAYDDTYRLAFEDETGLPTRAPPPWNATLRDLDGAPLEHVRLLAGETRDVVVRMAAGPAPPLLPREGGFTLAVTAQSVTTFLLRTTNRLSLAYEYPDRPNLRAAAVVVEGGTPRVGEPQAVTAFVRNTGHAPVHGVTLALLDRMDVAYGAADVALAPPGGGPPPVLDIAGGETRLATFVWTPAREGEHNLTLVVDTRNDHDEVDERDNVLAQPVLVPRARWPDLVVQLAATPADGLVGDPVEVALTVANRGAAPAAGVQVSLRAGASDLLPGDVPHVLPKAIAPGEAVTLEATWRPAVDGTHLLLARARTGAGALEPLETTGDNFAALTVRARGEGLLLEPPEPLALEPGAAGDARVVVRNRGALEETVALRAEPPDGWGARLGGQDVLRLTAPAGGEASAVLRVQAPRAAEAGPYAVAVQATSENATRRAVADVRVDVAQRHGLDLSLPAELALEPGARSVGVRLANRGNGPEVASVRAARLPAGWDVEPATVALAPGQALDFRLQVRSPPTTPPGAHRLVLEAVGRGGARDAAEAAVLVVPHAELRVRVEGLPEAAVPERPLEGLVAVRNDGNVPATARLALDAPDGWRLRLERDVLTLAPGEERRVPLGVVLPAGASGAGDVAARATGGAGAAEGAARVRPARADLALRGVELRPAGPLPPGAVLAVHATVANEGEGEVAAPLAAYLDGQLVAFDAGAPLAPGAERRVTFQVRAPGGGEHALLLAADPGGALAEADEDDNARVHLLRAQATSLFATPGAPDALALLAVLGLALARRRRR